MLARVSRLATVVLMTAGLAACGGKSKGSTTPGAGSGSAGGADAAGMNDGDAPVGGDTGGAPGGGELPGGGGDGGELPDGGEPGAGGDDGGATGAVDDGVDDGPAITPPDLDPDPEQARAGVQAHLRTGRDALRAAKPDPDLAIKEAKAALAIEGTNLDAVALLAHGYYAKKLYDTAETVLDMVFKDREAARNHAGIYYVYGLVYDKINEPVKAKQAYQKAVSLKGDHVGSLINLGVHHLKDKQYDEAMAIYEKLTGGGVTDAKTWSALGSAYRGKSADFDPGSSSQADWLLKAENAYKRATTADREYGRAYYNLGLLYLDANPFPSSGGGTLDNLVRLQQAKTYFDEYKNMPGVDMKLYDARMKDVTKLIKREEKKRKAKES